MSFISENYVWIIVVVVIIVMTIVGYIADKKDFGTKEKKKKGSKEKNIVMEQSIEEDNSNMEIFDKPIDYSIEQNNDILMDEVVEMPIIDDGELANQTEIEHQQPIEPEYEANDINMQEVTVREDLDQSYNDNNFEKNEQSLGEVKYEEIEPVMPLDSFEMPSDEVNSISSSDEINNENVYTYEGVAENNVTSSDETNSQNFSGAEEIVENSPFLIDTNEEKIQSVEPEIFEFPNIEQLDQEITDFEEDEDVWKF